MTIAEMELPGLEDFPPEDATTIRSTLGLLFEVFILRRAQTLSAVYSDDADWVNAFGSLKKGRAAIVNYLEGLFADENFKAGQLVGPPKFAARKLSPEAVVISSHLQIRGQGLVGGAKSQCATTTPRVFFRNTLMAAGSSFPRCTRMLARIKATQDILSSLDISSLSARRSALKDRRSLPT